MAVGAAVKAGRSAIRTGFVLLACMTSWLAGAPAQASLSETISVQTIYGYGFLGTPFVNIAPIVNVRNGASVAGFPAEYGLDVTTTSSADQFFFLHNQYCVGKCTLYTMTTVTILLQNSGDSATTMRFDSQITAGHLARQGLNDTSSAIFDFDVTQTTNGVAHALYSADGIASAAKTEITTSDGVGFNGLTRSSNGAAWEVLDWSPTNLNLLLDAIPAFGSSTITYTSMTRTSTSTSQCADLTNCTGVQVAFGDPRNNGGSANFMARSSGGTDDLFAASLAPVIGRRFGAAAVTADVVDPETPLPPTPKVLPRLTYGAPFTSQLSAVPEPGRWVMMIGGLMLVGIGLRRDRAMVLSTGA